MEGSVAPNIEEPHAAPESQASVIETDPSIGQAGAEGNVAQASAVTESTQAVPAKQQDLSQLRQQNPKSPKQQVTQSTASVQPPLSKASSDAAPRQAAKIQQKLKLVPRQTPHKTALSDTTILSESLSQFKASFLEFKQGLIGALKWHSQQKGASGSRGQTNMPKASKRGKAPASTLTIAPRASAKPGTAAAPSPDTQVELYAGTGAQRAAFLVPSEEDDFIPGRTESGSSYGSLQPYVDSWNAGDLAEKNINSRTTVYKQLLDDHRRASNTLKVAQQELSFTKAESKKHLEKVLKELADANAEKDKLAGQLKQEQEEVASLKNQLAETSESHKAELERAASEKTRLENEKLKIQGVADEAEKKSAAAEEAARQFQVRIDAWTAEFKKVQDNMHANFPESTPRVATAVANFRKYICKEEWIERRRDMATYFTERADLHTFNPNLPFPVEEDEEEEENEGDDVASAEKDDGAEASVDAEAAPRTETDAPGSGTTAETEAPAA
ncbi:hypothetical protein ACQ4PT_003197 [Festuca glaucescens]